MLSRIAPARRPATSPRPASPRAAARRRRRAEREFASQIAARPQNVRNELLNMRSRHTAA